MVKKYGIISDLHKVDPGYVALGIEILKKQEINGLILNGDIIGDQFLELNNQDYLAILLDYIGRSCLETYILPGSHETVAEVEPVVKYFQEKFSNLIYVIEEPIIDKGEHQLIFLPGSDWRPGDALENGYCLEDSKYKTGIYKTQNGNLMRIINIKDLKKYVKDPSKTILFSHIPKNFSKSSIAVDMAEFGEVEQDFYLNKQRIEKGSIFSGPIAYQLANVGFPIKLKRENRGNKSLAKIIEETGIKKHITGHFHESVHRAHTLKEELVEEGQWTEELFFMASYMDAFKVGLLEVDGEKVKYYRVNLKEFLK